MGWRKVDAPNTLTITVGELPVTRPEHFIMPIATDDDLNIITDQGDHNSGLCLCFMGQEQIEIIPDDVAEFVAQSIRDLSEKGA